MMTNWWLSRTAGSGPELTQTCKAIFTRRLSHVAGPCSRGREGEREGGRGLEGWGRACGSGLSLNFRTLGSVLEVLR